MFGNLPNWTRPRAHPILAKFPNITRTINPKLYLPSHDYLYLLGGGGVNRFSDRLISQKKLFRFRIWWIFYTYLRISSIQQIADLPNILARIVDLACTLVWILDCAFIVELLADSNLDKTIVELQILLQIWADRRICIPLFTPHPLFGVLIKYITLWSSCSCSACNVYTVRIV
jgi:hypothetical protein